MADPAILSVVFTGTVGVLGAATATTGHFVTLGNEERKRREARREDLRAVLDDAVQLAMAYEQFLKAVAEVEAGLEQMPRATMMSAEAVRAAARELGSKTTAKVASALDIAESESKVALKQFMVAAHSRVGANV